MNKERSLPGDADSDWKVDRLLKTHPLLGVVADHVADAVVLDVGCVGHGLEKRYTSYPFVHDLLCRYADRVIGIDIQEPEIEALTNEGYTVFCQNAESFSVDETFDVIFAGDLIEHLANPGLFLDRCHQHLRPDGVLLLVTPNAFCLNRLLCNLLFLDNDPNANPEHTCWFSPIVFRELLGRSGFSIESIRYIDSPKMTKRWGSRMTDRLCRLFGARLRETMVVSARPFRD
ncbi:MAG: class I SAM-dependent methyltransferase [Planctomycetota bacterium]